MEKNFKEIFDSQQTENFEAKDIKFEGSDEEAKSSLSNEELTDIFLENFGL